VVCGGVGAGLKPLTAANLPPGSVTMNVFLGKMQGCAESFKTLASGSDTINAFLETMQGRAESFKFFFCNPTRFSNHLFPNTSIPF